MQHNYARFVYIQKRHHKSPLSQVFMSLLLGTLFLLGFSANVRAEGVQQVAPSADDMVMLLIGDAGYGSFGIPNGPASSRLYVHIQNPSESLYLGLSREYNSSGQPDGSGFYSFQIKDAVTNSVVHGPYTMSNLNENVSNWEQASGPAVLNGGTGYATDDERFVFEPGTTGLYYIEFLGANFIGYWDFTVGLNGNEIPGRVYSRSWAFRTPVKDNEFPECVWDRDFNGVLYSYTTDGFVSKIDFSDSGFQGLSFSVAFNSSGPGESGDVSTDRMSIPAASSVADNAEHLIFLEEPDPLVFLDGECGEIFTASYFECTGNGSYCLDVSVTIPGQVEVILDFNQNGLYDANIDRRLLHCFEAGQSLTECLEWDGLLGDGTVAGNGETLNLVVSYTQGVQHWALFDGEYLKNGFCVEPVRPLCSEELVGNELFWDDRNIPDDPGTGQTKDGRDGCNCETSGCRTWNNFNTNADNCSNVSDGITTGYGDKNILNTWWYASSTVSAISNVPLVDVSIDGESSVCEGFSTELTLNWMSSAELASITWSGPNGVIVSGADAPNSITVNEVGTYQVTVIDEQGCTFSAEHVFTLENCPADLELDILANNLTPEIGNTVSFTITINNVGPSNANGVDVQSLLPAGLINIDNITGGGTLNGNAILWDDLVIDVDQQLSFTFTGVVTPAFDYTISAEIIAANQPDTDSTPNNGVDTNNNGNCSDDNGDEDDGDCVVLTPAACTITANVGTAICNDNNTPSDPSDDTFMFSLTVNGGNGSNSWVAAGDISLEGDYGTAQMIGPFPISGGDLDFTVADTFFEGGCLTNVHVDAPATCSDLCAIDVEIGSIVCLNNGTLSDGSDDEFTVDVRVTGANLGGQWEDANGFGNNYDEWITLGPFLISTGDVNLSFTDNVDDNCTTSMVVPAPPSCSTDCSISATAQTAVCDDNGTPSDFSDDTFTFTVEVSGLNHSDTWTVNDDLGSTGVYDTGIILGPYPISGGNLSLIIQDANDESCMVQVNVQAPATCSDLCVMSYELGAASCFNNETPSFAGDDEFSYEIIVAGANTGSSWTSSNGQTGTYNTSVNIGPFPIAGGAVEVTFTDIADPDCSVTTVALVPPSTCSNDCELVSTNISSISCDDNGTPTDPTDDLFSFGVLMEGYNTSDSWIGQNGTIGNYDVPYIFGPYPIADGTVEFTVVDSQHNECTTNIYVQVPSTCSDQCNIASQALNILCWDNGTPADPSDDEFTFDLVLTALNNAGPAWIQADGNAGFYDQVYPQGPFPIAGGDVTMHFSDVLDETCVSTLVVSPPLPCSESCELVATVLSTICNDQNTLLNPFDDTFTYEIQVAGINIATSWYASDGTVGDFDVTTLSVPHNYSIDALTIEISDINDLCSTSIEVLPPVISVSCPDDIATYDGDVNVQVISGALMEEDSMFTDIPCFLALNSTPMTIDDRFFDAIIIYTPDDTDATDYIYTFQLYTNIETTIVDPVMESDGVGALFYGDYMALDDPCCFSVSNSMMTPNNYTPSGENPTVDTSMLFDEPMFLVQSFTKRLERNLKYSLVTTTYDTLAVGEYAWVIVGKPILPIQVEGGDEVAESEFFEEEEILFDLTYFDIDSILNNTNSLDYFGSASFESSCGADDLYFEDVLNFEDNCEIATIERTFYATGNGILSDSCTQLFSFRRPIYDDIILPPTTAIYNCGDDYQVNSNGFPHPIESGYPVVSTFTDPAILLENSTYYNFLTTYKDIDITDTLTDVTTLIREWSFVDVCSGDTILIVPQTIKIGSFDPPALECPLSNHYCPIIEDDIMLFDVDPLECTGTVDIPLPNIVSDCGNGNAWQIFTEILFLDEPDTVFITAIEPDSIRIVPDLVIGDYLIHYLAEDSLGVILERYCRFRVADLQQPTALCRGDLSVSLNGAGLYRVYPNQLDIGSWDNCGPVTFELRRLYTRDPITCDTLLEPYHGDWLPFVDLNCCDAGLTIPIELRVTDIYGNQNVCWTNIHLSDNTLPYCTGLSDITLACSMLPDDFNPTDTLQLQALFGYPEVVDNCAAFAVETEPIVDWNNCQSGTIVRQFHARDQVGNISAQVFEQVINITYFDNYGIRFPKDTDTDCVNNADTLLVMYPGCGDIDVTFDDAFLPVEGAECYFIQRTYHVINQCYYDGISLPTVISRDEDCDGAEGEENVWVLVRPNENGSFVDADSLHLNLVPAAGQKGTSCDGTTNPEGFWRQADNLGYWTYVQLIKVFDNEAPVINFVTPEPFCTDSISCEGWVNIPLDVTEYCLPENLSEISVLLDIGGDGVVDEDLTGTGVLVGQWPNYALQGYFGIGDHAFVLGLTDGCNNVGGANIPFSVVDCYVPELVCFSGLIVNLESLLVETDVDGDGDLDEAAVYVAASALGSCELLDFCSDPIRYSVNRIGQTPNIDSTVIALTCDDRYQIELEVYAWDSVYNPYAVQPDGTIGGPNYRYCTVLVLVQDTDFACEACLEAELGIEGQVFSIFGNPINEVIVDLYKNGEADLQKSTGFNGHYDFFGVEFAQNYQVIPFKNDDIMNGITLLDLILLNQFESTIDNDGNPPPNTEPTLLVAGDVNRSGTITTLDILNLQQVFLGQSTSFPFNTSWRFFPSDFTPTIENYNDMPDHRLYEDLLACQFDQDFVGVKIGDMNGTVSEEGFAPNGIDARTTWPIEISDHHLAAGSVQQIPVRARDVDQISGLQFSLDFDPALVNVIEIEPGLISPDQISTINLSSGVLTVLWLNNNTVNDHDVLFTMVVQANQEAQKISEVFSISDRILAPEVYDQAFIAYDGTLDFVETAEGVVLLANHPDPFETQTNIAFYLPIEGEAVLEIQDVNGKTLKRIQQHFSVGMQNINFDGDDLPAGVLTYTLTFEGRHLSRKMIKL